jgi:hypothetical protein
MSPIRNLRPSTTAVAEAEPFRYGWRFVYRKQLGGSLIEEQVPLTLEDLLLPEEGDFIAQTVGHNQDRACLMLVLKARLAGDPSAVVISDCRVAWDVPGLKPLGPDVAVFFGMQGYEDWGTLDVAREGAISALVVEVTSPDTRTNDVGIKKEFYHRARRAAVSDRGCPIEEGRSASPPSPPSAHPGRLRANPPNERRLVWLDSFGIWLVGAEGAAVCYDGETAEEIGDYTSVWPGPRRRRGAGRRECPGPRDRGGGGRRECPGHAPPRRNWPPRAPGHAPRPRLASASMEEKLRGLRGGRRETSRFPTGRWSDAILVGVRSARAPRILRGAGRRRWGHGRGRQTRRVFRAYLDRSFRDEPLSATRLGDHRFDDRLDDLSAEARAGNLERDRRTLAELPTRVDRDQLSRDARIDFDIFRHHLVRSIWLAENFKPFEDDPRVYGDYLTESVYLLLAQSSLPRAKNLENALARMARIPEVVKVSRATIGNPPRVKVETAILQTKGAIGFYQDELFTLAGEPKGQGELGETGRGDRRGPPRAPGVPGARGLSPFDRGLADRRGEVRPQAGARARRRDLGRRGRADGEGRGGARRAGDGRDRPPVVGDDLPREGPPPPTMPRGAAP